MKRVASFRVNGRDCEVAVSPRLTLLELLRDELGLTGTKRGCGEGECGTCTVLLDGAPVNSCLVLALEATGREVTTIEGLADGPRLHPLQRAFVEVGAIQCGFCTPGMILAAKALLDGNPNPTEVEIREALAGNLCRCTGYQKIVEAVQTAASAMGDGREAGR
jgi:carbon-monoxide dehydrogenase small subunit